MLSKLVPIPSGAMIPDRDIGKKPILECVNLGITFGGLKAVEDFNLTIGRTEIAGLIGPNGAGKTTVFNLLTKVYQPTHGTILLGGLGNIWGSLIAAAALTVLPELLRAFSDYRMLVYAVVLILVMLTTNNPTLKSFFGRFKPGRSHGKEAA